MKNPDDHRHVAIMDTTLRDGEQTPDVAYTPAEKLQLAKLLLQEVEVDRIEIASTRVSEGEREAARQICAWARKARCLQRVEVLGYCDGKASVDWLAAVGGKTLNLLTKGSERHCREQLRMTPLQHRKAVEDTVRSARRRRMVVNVYLEDWSNGVRESFDYVFAMIQLLRELRVTRVYLADTLGVFSPEDTARYVGLMTATWPAVDFEFHAHNDYSLATANCLAALREGVRGLHTSVNGMGERAGNTKLAELVAAVHDHTDMRTGVNEARLSSIAQMVETSSGKEIASNSPIVGRDVFTQTAGIHADGDAKGDLYASRLAPARFGRARRYALGKLSGKASLDHNLKTLGIELDPMEHAIVLERIIELGDRKHTITPEDLPYIIADVLKTPEEQLVRVETYHVVVGGGEEPKAAVKLSFGGAVEEAEATGSGGYDAFMNAVRKAARTFEIDVPRLADYRVRIPPGGRSAALVETVISWRRHASTRPAPGDETFATIGVDADQLGAAVIATEKMLNAVVPRRRGRTQKPTKAQKSARSGKSSAHSGGSGGSGSSSGSKAR
jgi:D-citramalate synthase